MKILALILSVVRYWNISSQEKTCTQQPARTISNSIYYVPLIMCLCTELLPGIVYGQQLLESNYRPFVASEYKVNEFRITKKEFQNGKTSIRIIEAKRTSNFENPPHVCRAWLEVMNLQSPQQATFKKYFDDINPVGFSFGLFIPKIGLPPPFFAVVKNGDYDGRLFLIQTDGKVFDMVGGLYFVTDDKRYLFSVYASDISRIAVFDLKEGRLVFSSDELPHIHQWYLNGPTYFFTASEWLPENYGIPTEKEGLVYFYNFRSNKIVEKSISAAQIASAKKVAYDFNPVNYENCTLK